MKTTSYHLIALFIKASTASTTFNKNLGTDARMLILFNSSDSNAITACPALPEMPSKAAVRETLCPSYVPHNEHHNYMAFKTKMCIRGNILPPAIGTPKEAQNEEVPMSELLDIAANLPLPHTSISPRAGIADSINTDSFKEGENDPTTAHQSATTAAPTPILIHLLELLLAAPAWRADGSETTATARARGSW